MSISERPVTRYESYTEARKHLKDLLDTASEGRVVVVERSGDQLSVIKSEVLRGLLVHNISVRPEMVHEDDAWAIFVPGMPLAAEAEDIDAAVDELIAAIREYAEDWHARLRFAPNHQTHLAFVQFMDISTDQQIREWIIGSEA
ncbi:MAG: hypothetical protein JJE02_09310 [Propionibacteriales bacterium]|nr:hypothetical protein [Propionibacteriales bacterium]